MEKYKILNYNKLDVDATERLYQSMLASGQININYALIRGLYSWLTGIIEQNGIPIDVDLFNRVREHWDLIEAELIRVVDDEFKVFNGRTFKTDRFVNYLKRENLSWICSDDGKPLLDSNTFKEMVRRYPQIAPLYELRKTLGQTRIKDFPVGSDGRNRTSLRPFGSITGRNQPRTSGFIFGGAKWNRSFIKPSPGQALAYVDQSQQEDGIAAALSKDKNKMDAYLSGDPYLAFAKQAGAVPLDATRKSHPKERELYKSCSLAVQYGMGVTSLAQRIGKPEIYAYLLLGRHKETYKTFWDWNSRVLEFARTRGFLETTFGWKINIEPNFNERSISNFLMQANGAEILRLATIEAFHKGIKVIALIHDAILIEAPIDEIDEKTKQLQNIFSLASEIVLDGFRLSSDAVIIKYPDRFVDEKGQDMWGLILKTLKEVENGQL